MEQGFQAAATLLEPALRRAALTLPERDRLRAEEFRLRAGRPPTVLLAGRERRLRDAPVTEEELRGVAERASAGSYHAVADQLAQGYVTGAGGVRVGICGRAVTDGTVIALRELSSAALRIPRQVRGAGAEALSGLGAASVLILSPPGGGKTTLLRELVRTRSDAGVRVGLADERGEVAAAVGGVPAFDVGACTDVVTGAPKAQAAALLLRSMNPQAIAMDELSSPEDAAAVWQAAGCGVALYATAHAAGPEELKSRPLFRPLLEARLFQKAVTVLPGEPRRYRVSEL